MNPKEYLSQEDGSGKYSKQNWLSKNNHMVYQEVMEFSKKYHDQYPFTFKEKVYLYLNDIHTKPMCKNSDCMNMPKFVDKKTGYLEYCSRKCQGSSPEVKNKRESTNFEIYGHQYAIYNKDIRDKFNTAIQDRTLEEKSISNMKRKSTNLKNFGYDNPNKNPEYIEKRIESFKSNIDSWKSSYERTSLERYQTQHPSQNKSVYSKNIQTNMEIYGTEHPMKNETVKNKSLSNKKNTNFKKNIQNTHDSKLRQRLFAEYGLEIGEIDRTNYKSYNSYTLSFDVIHNFSCIHEEYNISYGLLIDRISNSSILCTKCNDPLDNKISSFHLEVYGFIASIYKGDILLNDRKMLDNKEIDIFLPQLNIGFECNGLYWHTEKMRGKYYHKEKYDMCKEKGIELIQIWEDDWKYEKDKTKSRISEVFDMNEDINPDDVILVRNVGKYHIELYINDILIGETIFDVIDDKNIALEKIHTIKYKSRQCLKIMLDHIIGNFYPETIIYDVSLEWNDVEIYKDLGFIETDIFELGCYYISCNRKYIFSLSECEILNPDKIWTCGYHRMILHIDKGV